MPRAYRMGERAAAMDATRARILESAIELFSERGISATTTREIGERADVAPGTLRKHFSTRDALEAAMVERLEAEGPLPELDVLDGADSIEERVARLLHVAGTFFERSARLHRMWLREPLVTGPWLAAGERYGTRWNDLMRRALGPLADDATAAAVLRSVIDPRYFEGLRAGGRSTAEVADLVAEVVTHWFVNRVRPPRARRPRAVPGSGA